MEKSEGYFSEGHFLVKGEMAQELIRRGYKPTSANATMDENGGPVWSFDLTPDMLQVLNEYFKRRGKSMLFTIEERLEKQGLRRNGIEVRG